MGEYTGECSAETEHSTTGIVRPQPRLRLSFVWVDLCMCTGYAQLIDEVERRKRTNSKKKEGIEGGESLRAVAHARRWWVCW